MPPPSATSPDLGNQFGSFLPILSHFQETLQITIWPCYHLLSGDGALKILCDTTVSDRDTYVVSYEPFGEIASIESRHCRAKEEWPCFVKWNYDGMQDDDLIKVFVLEQQNCPKFNKAYF